MDFINLTPHDVNLMDEAGNVVKTYPSKGILRVTYTETMLPSGICQMYADDLEGPDGWRNFSHVIVSRAAAMQLLLSNCTDHRMVVFPDQVVIVDGKPVGCRRLAELIN